MLKTGLMNVPGYERVVHFEDQSGNVAGFIAIHSTARGSAAGGCRVWEYPSESLALDDALRLAKGMSFKNALADLPLGGGKGVIFRSKGVTREHVFHTFGDAVESLKGAYVTAEDVGTTVADMQTVAAKTKHVSGVSGGDPSPYTAMGVFLAMREATRRVLGRPSLSRVRVAVQGTGNVGRHLCGLVRRDGGVLLVSDIDDKELLYAKTQFQAEVVPVDAIHSAACDIFAPCALGGVLNARTIPTIKAALVCGAANNQLGINEDGELLLKRKICYVPDYVANAGGIINVAAEHLAWSAEQVTEKINRIPTRVADILRLSAQTGRPTSAIADDLAVAALNGKERSGREPALARARCHSGG